MDNYTALVFWLDFIGVGVFAASGALVASRKEMDLVGFGLLATVTGIGGGTLRDVLLDRPVAWVWSPEYPMLCVLVAVALFFIAPSIQRRFPVLLWADAAGLAVFAVLGAKVANEAGVGLFVAAVMGVITASFGGLLRDIIGNEIPLILRKEIYASAAALGALTYLILESLGAPGWLAETAGFAVGLILRAMALVWGWSLPAYRPRPGRDYPMT